jgi:hypothetical protein
MDIDILIFQYISLFITFCGKFAMAYFIARFYIQIFKMRYTYKPTIIGLILGQLVLSYVFLYSQQKNYVDAVMIIILTVFLLGIFFDENYLKRAVFVVILKNLSKISLSLMAPLDRLNTLDNFITNHIIFCCISIIVYMLSCMILYYLPKKLNLIASEQNSSYWITMLLTSILITVCVDLIFYYNYLFDGAKLLQMQDTLLSRIVHSILMIALFLFALLCNIMLIVETNNRINAALLQKHLQLQICRYQEIEQSFKHFQSVKHDLHNHLACLKTLLDQNKTKESCEYIYSMIDTVELLDVKTYTGNPFADALLNEKYYKALQDYIDLQFDIQPIEILIQPMDLCIILGNAIDNAIEACNRMDPLDTQKYITIKIILNKGYLLIEVVNSIVFVFKNKKTTVEKYQGFLDIDINSTHFTLNIMMLNG